MLKRVMTMAALVGASATAQTPHFDPGLAQLIYASDFGAALGDTSPQGYGRRYVGAWEVRNLRMVANIRSVLAAHPGKRLLTIVGASHKPCFEAYLSMMHDVKVVPVDTILN